MSSWICPLAVTFAKESAPRGPRRPVDGGEQALVSSRIAERVTMVGIMPDSVERPTDAVAKAIDPLISEVLDGRYRLDAVIGRGGMGAVYRAFDSRLERPVAVKVLHGAEHADEARFASEVKTLARFAHPNLVRLLDAGELGSRAYLVMEIIVGPTLAQLLAEGPLESEDVARIGIGVASALGYVHSHGVVHRDIKPANVLIDQRGAAHLTDFGIAQLVDSTGMTATGMTLGTPAYLAPEQVQGTRVGPPADIYMLGLVLLESLIGRRAFEGTASEVAVARLVRSPSIPKDLDRNWPEIIKLMTQRRPSDRITAEQVVSMLSEHHYASAIPGALAVGALASDVTIPMYSAGGAETRMLDITETAIAPIGLSRFAKLTARFKKPMRERRRYRGVLIGLAALGLLAGLTLAGVVFGSSPKHPNLVPPTTQHTTTTLAPLTVSRVTGDLVAQIGTGETNGTIAMPTGRQLVTQLQPLLFASTSGSNQTQVQQFDQFVTSFDQGVVNGQIVGGATMNQLTGSIATLAQVLHTTVPTTTTTIPTGPGPGPGHGHGDGNGNGN